MNKKIISIVLLFIVGVVFANNVLAMTCSSNGKTIPCSEMPIWFWIFVALFQLIFLVVGILSLYKPFIEWSIKFQNKLTGTKTEITPTAIKYRKIMGVLMIIFTIVFLFFGFFASKNSVIDKPVVEQSITSQLPARNQNEIADWKTYTNKENGFEIKYPKEWFVQVEEGCANLCGCKVRLASQSFPTKRCPLNGGERDCWPNETPSGAIFDINTFCTPDDSAYKNFTDSMNYRETFKLGGVIATIGDDSIIYSYPNTTFSPDQAYNFFHNGLQYVIRTTVYVRPSASELEAEVLGNNFLPIFEQMLSTFKFIK